LLATGGAELLRDDMVEKVAAAAVRAAIGVEEAARRAIGLTALQETADRWRRDRVAALQRLRLKADILISFCRSRKTVWSFRKKGERRTCVVRGLMALGK
jgi:hypothetical protein